MNKRNISLSLLLSINASIYTMDLSLLHGCETDLHEIETSDNPTATACQKKALATSLGIKNYFLLHAAVITQKRQCIEPLVMARFEDEHDKNNQYPLDYALNGNDTETIDELLKNKVSKTIIMYNVPLASITPETLIYFCDKMLDDNTYTKERWKNIGAYIMRHYNADCVQQCYQKGYLKEAMPVYPSYFLHHGSPDDQEAARIHIIKDAYTDTTHLDRALERTKFPEQYDDAIWLLHAYLERQFRDEVQYNMESESTMQQLKLLRQHAPVDRAWNDDIPNLISQIRSIESNGDDIKANENLLNDMKKHLKLLQAKIEVSLAIKQEIPESIANETYMILNKYRDISYAGYVFYNRIYKHTSDGRNYYNPLYWLTKYLNGNAPTDYQPVATADSDEKKND